MTAVSECTRCGETKPLEEFYTHPRRKNGRYAWCKACVARKWAEERADPKTWPRTMIRRVKHRALKRGLEFDLTADDIVVPDVCPVLGIPLVLGNTGTVGENDNSPSIDRFDNGKGYVKSNIRVISTRANLLKRDATVEEIKLLLAYMESV